MNYRIIQKEVIDLLLLNEKKIEHDFNDWYDVDDIQNIKEIRIIGTSLCIKNKSCIRDIPNGQEAAILYMAKEEDRKLGFKANTLAISIACSFVITCVLSLTQFQYPNMFVSMLAFLVLFILIIIAIFLFVSLLFQCV